MSTEKPDTPLQDPHGQLERAFIEEFVRARGYDPRNLGELLPEHVAALLKEASTYAASKLAELESRARLIHDIHGDH